MRIETFQRMRAMLMEHLADPRAQKLLSVPSSARRPRNNGERAKLGRPRKVVASRRGHESGPVDEALGVLGLTRTVVAVVPSFRAALSVASVSDLLALVTDSFFNATQRHQARSGPAEVRSFALPVRTEAITVSQMWHPRLDADPAHRWLRGLVLATCRAKER